MTLNTDVFVLDEIDRREVFNEVRRLLGATDAHPWDDKPDSWRGDGASTLANACGIGLDAWLILHYRPDAPLRTPEQATEHEDWCDDDCDGSGHSPACWLEFSIDTAYGYRKGLMGCGDLHALLVAQIGRWLDERGIQWGWQNEFTGEKHFGEDRYERLRDLCRSGKEAEAWFVESVAPAIAAAGARLA